MRWSRFWSILLGIIGLTPLTGRLSGQTWFTDAFQDSRTSTGAPDQSDEGFLKLGPIVVGMYASASIKYTDNIDFSSVAQAGTELSSGLGFSGDWQTLQAAEFSVSGQWLANHWITGDGPDQAFLTIQPGSTLRYSIYVDYVKLTPFVNLERTYDPGLVPTVGNTPVFEQSSYDGGLEVEVPLNKLSVELMGLRGFATTSGSGLDNSDTNRTLLSARIVRDFNSRLSAGFEYYAVFENFRNAPAASGTNGTGRLIGSAQLTATLKAVVAVGIEAVTYAQPATAGDSTRHTQLIEDLNLTEQLRKNIGCTLRISDQVSDNFTTDYYRTLSAEFSSDLKLNERTTLAIEAGWQHIVQSVSATGSGDFWTKGAQLQFAVSDKLSLHLVARSLINHVVQSGQGYRENNLELSADRRF